MKNNVSNDIHLKEECIIIIAYMKIIMRR